MAGVVLKVRFKDELHRLTLENVISFSDLEHILRDFFGPDLPAHSIKYADDDDDMITISTDVELKEAINFASKHAKLLRLYIFDVQQPHIQTSHHHAAGGSHTDPSASSFGTPQAAALNTVALDLAKMILSSMASQSPHSAPPEQLSAFQPLIGQLLNQSVQEMLPHLLSSLMPAVASQLKPAPRNETNSNPLIAGVLGQAVPSQQPAPRQSSPSPPASVSELYPTLAPLFSSLSSSTPPGQPSAQKPGTGAPVPVPIPRPSTPQSSGGGAAPSTSPVYSAIPSSPPPTSTNPQPPPYKSPSTMHSSQQLQPHQLPHAPRVYPPFNYAPISPASGVPNSLPSPYHAKERGRLESRCTTQGTMSEELVYGERFIRKWGWKNEGSAEWPANCSMRIINGESFGFPGGGVLIPQSIKPGESVEISVELVTPRAEGTHVGQFGLFLPTGEPIGFPTWLQVKAVHKKEPHDERGSFASPGNVASGPPAVPPKPLGPEALPSPTLHSLGESLPLLEPAALERSLDVMASMGFHDRTANKDALLRHNGDVSLAINELFSSN